MEKRLSLQNVAATIAVFSFFSLGGCVASKQKLLDSGVQPMAKADFQELLSKELNAEYINVKGQRSSVQYYPDGTQKFQSKKFSDVGRWSIKNDEQCSIWSNLRNGQEKCFTWFKVSEYRYDLFDTDGSKAGTLTIK